MASACTGWGIRSPTRSSTARCRASRVSPENCCETINSEKCPPPPAAPACPACSALSSASSKTLGASEARRASSVPATFIGRPRSLLRLLHVAREHQALRQREGQEEPDPAPHFEVDPGFEREVECDVPVEDRHGKEKGGPRPRHPRPHGGGQRDVLQQGADQVAPEGELADYQYGAEQAVENRRLPADEYVVLEPERRAAEH